MDEPSACFSEQRGVTLWQPLHACLNQGGGLADALFFLPPPVLFRSSR